MPLVLPLDHPARDAVATAPRGATAVRLGIVNVMPRLEAYEPLLLRRLADASVTVEPVFVRLESHAYRSSDRGHLDRFYRPFAEAGALDGLIVTGAPVEEIAFEEVRYWRELGAILNHARERIRSTLGLCWGALALGALFGVPKRLRAEKLFGVFAHEGDGASLAAPRFLCPHSRHAGFDGPALERAAAQGSVHILARLADGEPAVFASADRRFVGHVGHPEYDVERLVFEWQRDEKAGRTDVPRPQGVDLAQPTTTWRADSDDFFGRWLRLLGGHVN